MADRFPSLEEFDSGAQLDLKDTGAEPSAEDLLAREKALLGDDARQFATSEDDAGETKTGENLLSQGDHAQSTFESQFPDLAPSGVNTSSFGNTSVTEPSVNYNSGFQPRREDEEESESVKEWRSHRDAQISKRADQFSAQREETIKEAQQNIDDFYENYNAKKENGIAQTRKEADEFLASREDMVSGGTSWDRITKLVDVSGKGNRGGSAGSGKERFRELLTSLRKDEKAPGATGY